MNTGKTLFAQLMEFLPWKTFSRIVARYGGHSRVRTLSRGAPMLFDQPFAGEGAGRSALSFLFVARLKRYYISTAVA